MTQHPIDIVVPWVDGGDPAWQAERAAHSPVVRSDNSDARYREWGLFHYWFRSIERYAPWVRKVHLITWGHLPPWLNTDHPKLHIVNHRDYIPAEFLPTFSSHTIELNMHRIPDLAEHFIYFNDDVYLTAPTEPTDFFVDGVPRDTAVFGMVRVADNFSFMPYIDLNMLGNINQTFSKKACLKQHFSKWFNLKYGKDVLMNLYLLPGTTVAGFKNFHTCLPYCKKTLEEVWEAYFDDLDATCHRRFRSREDVNQYLFRYWRLMKGEFVPSRPNSRYLTIGHDSDDTIAAALSGGKYKVVCVNDDPMSCDFESEQARITAMFEARFPAPCAFEK